MINFFGTPINNGVTRAAARLAAHRKAQAERLKDAPAPAVSRQQKRREDLLYWKRMRQEGKKRMLKRPLSERVAVAS